MIESIKLKLLAMIINLLSSNMTNQSVTEEDQQKYFCEQKDRLEVMAEATTIGTYNMLCGNHTVLPKDHPKSYLNEICWGLGHEQLAFNMISMAFYETRFMERIHEGKCLSNECDPVYGKWKAPDGKYYTYVVRHKARTPWQIHYTRYVKKVEWEQLTGTDLESTIVAATAAARVFTFARNRCRTDWGGYSLYATGKTCKWSGAGKRVYTSKKYRKLTKDPEWVSKQLELLNNCN